MIDSGTWDPTDENMVSIDPYKILKQKKIHKNIHKEDLKQYFEECKKSQHLFFLDTDDELQDKEFDYFYFRQIWKIYLCIFYIMSKIMKQKQNDNIIFISFFFIYSS